MLLFSIENQERDGFDSVGFDSVGFGWGGFGCVGFGPKALAVSR
jgi:hypothetical protein